MEQLNVAIKSCTVLYKREKNIMRHLQAEKAHEASLEEFTSEADRTVLAAGTPLLKAGRSEARYCMPAVITFLP